ncbi:MAG: OmpA family protein [Polyangiaceae bacterium]
MNDSSFSKAHKRTRMMIGGLLMLSSMAACKAQVEVTTQPPPPPPAPPPAPAPPPPPKIEAITVSERIQFETDSDVLKEQSKVVLGEVVKVLKDNPHITLVEIGGHTDDVGGKDDNLLLSQRRAESVKAYLITQGIAENRMRAMGYGTRVPVAPNDTEAGRMQNRRVEFRVVEQAGN